MMNKKTCKFAPYDYFQKLVVVVALSCVGQLAQAQAQLLENITPEQIAQFQALPPAMQQQLAAQFGVDLSVLEGITGGSLIDTGIGQVGEPLEQVEPYVAPPESLQEESELINSEPELQLERYGLTLFDREVSTFAPVDDAPIPSNYVIGPGDSLNILLFGSENRTLSLQVDREGVLNIPEIGAIPVGGLSFAEAKLLIELQVAERFIGVQVFVSVGRLRAINVFMSGEVRTPGAYAVSGLTTVTQALYVAGGVSSIGSLRDIRVLRNGEQVASFDAYDLLLLGDASNDVRLQSGDVIFVPPYFATASIDGAVKRPAIYELIPGQSVLNLIEMAGRFETNAYIKMVTLERFDRNNALPELINLDLTNSAGNDIELLDGDYVRIPEASQTFSNSVQIKGAVVRPGIFAYREGIRVSDLLPSIESHLNFDADLNYALVISIKNERLDIEVTSFDLGQAIANPGTDLDPLLKSRDEILIFDLTDVSEDSAAGSQSSFSDSNLDYQSALGADTIAAAAEIQKQSNRRELLEPIITKLRLQSRENEPVQIVSVSGAVKAPGEYPLKAGDRLSLLLSAAGGLTDNAFLNDAELQRVVVDANGFADSEITNIDLNRRFSDDRHNPVLASRDHIFVRAIPDWTPDRSVAISGEVRFPGTYQIGPRETIRDVVARAGGLTSIGFASGAIFTRESAREQQRAQLLEYVEDIQKNVAVKSLTQEEQNIGVSGVEGIVELLTRQEPLGRLIIDLPSILSGNNGADLVLQDGDSIDVPRQTTSVSVIGEVRRTGVYRYQESLSLEDYIEISAGLTVRADEDAIYVVKADGSVSTVKKEFFRFAGTDGSLSAGDTIVVPVDAEYRDTMTYWSAIVGIMYQTGIAVAAVVGIL